MTDTKRIITKKCIKHLSNLFPYFFDKRVHIIFDACEKFHFYHLEPIVKEILKDPRYKISIIRWPGIKPDDIIPNVNYMSFKKFWHDWFNLFDVLITTEIERCPTWFINDISICMFHGAGPKMSYIKNKEINNYNVLFSVGPTTQKVLENFVDPTVVVEKIGLPITDKLLSNKSALPHTIKLAPSKPTILYAPSWSKYPELISMNNQILDELASLNNYNVIIRPHPLLLQPKNCNGFDWNTKINQIKSKGVQISYSIDHSVYELMPYIDILLGDASSVTYEYLIFDKPIITYMKEGILKSFDAEEFIAPLYAATYQLDSPEQLESVLFSIKNEPEEISKARTELKNATLFNIGSATEVAVKTIEKYAFD
ncbi:MAG: hypothetical protein DIZ80_06390 [endosymbiont of Galathealinum brachiosum]|uniref:CDP-glycerol--glycerophosphate glycerophosphotransferase n=1 Tax=endosymbiont of Galathealinum brachiosum TaxID=2200906 RepID=A0A370DFS8_9GAMM|nr:MAG: hypothetical protein DIZ80_06390 [endosymbiont of Galathealinum brachiosum]